MQGRDAAPSDGEASPVAREEEGALVAWKEFSTHAKVGVRRKVFYKRSDTPQTRRGAGGRKATERDPECSGSSVYVSRLSSRELQF